MSSAIRQMLAIAVTTVYVSAASSPAPARTLGDDPAPVVRLAVVATHPALASIASQIGGDRVVVTSLCAPSGDVHSVEATPSVLSRLAAADVFVHSGLDLEPWVDDALKGARNARIKAGAPGNIDCSDGVEMLNVPANPSRADGDIHVYGNPHYWLDPLNGKKIGATIAAALSAVDPAHAAEYEAARGRFDDDIRKRLLGWLKRALPHKNAPIVCYHDSFPYFTRRFGLVVVEFVEPKPRIPPTQVHLQTLIDAMKQRGVKVIVREPFHDPAATEFVAGKTGAKVVTLSTLPGGIDATPTYQDLIDRDLTLVLGALE